MKALFIGQSYIDVTFLADELPTGDEKSVARTMRSRSAAMRSRRRSAAPSSASCRICSTSIADDWLGRMFIDMAAKYGISVHHRKVTQSSLSFIMPKGGQRAIVRCRDDHFSIPFPALESRRLPRAPCRRPSAGCRHPLCQDLPRGRHPDVARRRRLALEHS